ncbi:integrase [Streptomyces laculatispora]|uniref:Integrase n=1 Tax=Streptomyces laculatispora TaxID=887464 RepID=A0ABY9HVP4_9ACTN|nr:integrase [Streptomyces laculatispora]WLQ38600.1 integrase [Streptomyces laculatispora]
MLLRLPYLTLTSVFTFIRLLPMSDVDKNIEILTLRHQLAVLRRQVDKPSLTRSDRAFLAALLHRLPRPQLRQLHLIVSPDTVLRWHRDLLRRHHAKVSRPKRPGRPPTVRGIQAVILRLAGENPNWGYRRIHGELAALGITIVPSTVWKILKAHGIEPAPQRDQQTWADFLRGQAHAILAADFYETRTLTGARLYVFAVIEHATRRVHILSATAHPTADWTTQLARSLVMDLKDAAVTMKYLIRERDGRYTRAFDNVFEDEGIAIVKTGIRVPRMNAIMERWVRSCRAELLDRTLVLNQAHLLHALREYGSGSTAAHSARRSPPGTGDPSTTATRTTRAIPSRHDQPEDHPTPTRQRDSTGGTPARAGPTAGDTAAAGAGRARGHESGRYGRRSSSCRRRPSTGRGRRR